ncbi:MAG: histidinol-phosphate transaminase [Candidatus Accumulibacter sp.]|jgi:histidinol-phosphate aminotransferase|nr:histidinol-phosphate transaminase [Accumulibacter sp.]
MNPFWSPSIHHLIPYIPGEQPARVDIVKLNTNENPYPPSPLALAAIQEELGSGGARLRLYPDPDAKSLKTAIAAHFSGFGLTTGQIFVGNGSDEVLAHIFLALLKHGLPILIPDITYSFYPVYCSLYGIACATVPLDEEFRINIDDYRHENGGILLANPNAPTGRLLPLEEIDRLAKQHPRSVIVIDEAYIDFAGETVPTAIALVGRHPNLLIVRTLSKSHALAGLRIGYAVGGAELIEALERVKNSFNSYPLDRLAITGAAAAVSDAAYLEKTRRAIMKSRETLSGRLADLGFDVLPSASNFIFARHPQHDAARLFLALRERGIIVRHFRQPRIDQHLRITIGTDAQCEALVDALQDINTKKQTPIA